MVHASRATMSNPNSQHHFTASRDVADADPWAFRRDSMGQNLEEDLGRSGGMNRDVSVSFPRLEGFAADRDDLWVLKKRKTRSSVCAVGLGAPAWL